MLAGEFWKPQSTNLKATKLEKHRYKVFLKSFFADWFNVSIYFIFDCQQRSRYSSTYMLEYVFACSNVDCKTFFVKFCPDLVLTNVTSFLHQTSFFTPVFRI